MINKIVTFTVVFVFAVVFVSYFNIVPRLGSKPNEKRLERIKASDNFKGGQFVNTVETNMDKPPYEGIREMMRKDASRRPSGCIKNRAVSPDIFSKAGSKDMQAVWMGHSTILMRSQGVNIITDPVFTKRASMSKYIGPAKFDYDHDYRLENLPKINIVLISHDHYDHLDYEAIRFLGDKVDYFIMPLGVGAHLDKWKINEKKIIELDWWENFSYKGLTFTATPSRHFTGRGIRDRFKTLWCGFAIRSEKDNIFFSGDSGYFDGFKEIGSRLGPFDLSFMECGQYSKYWHEIHMYPEESVQASIDIKSKNSIPIHWGKFNLSIHSWNESPARFIKEAKQKELAYGLPEIGQVFGLSDLPASDWHMEE